MTPAEIAAELSREAGRLGLVLGIAPAKLPEVELERLRAWLARGDHGVMAYMERDPEGRADVSRALLPGARSVLVALLPYPPTRDRELPISTYARGNDYHHVLGERLAQLVLACERLVPGVRTKRFTDTAPVLERAYGHAAGLGFYGKNGCLIHPTLGSYFFLGGIALDAELPATGPADPLPSCGTCTRCIDACPTDAIPEPHRIDGRRCISYLTIEVRGPWPEELRALVGTRTFGCDACQAVCPWNAKFAPEGDPAFAPRAGLGGSLVELHRAASAGWKKFTRDTPLPRALRRGYLRNLATAMGNGRDPEELPALRELAASSDPDVSEHARWALARREREGPITAP